ncbi:MAG: hypothetical protein ACLQOO_09925 [Terriglobia bacterium]
MSRPRTHLRLARFGLALTSVLCTALSIRILEHRATLAASGELLATGSGDSSAGYVGSTECRKCHADIYDEFVKTAMGRSMSVPAESVDTFGVFGPVVIRNDVLDRYFSISKEGRDLYQEEYQLDSEGKDVFRERHRMEYVLGAGENGFSYVVRRGGYLVEAPITYYSRTKSWGLSPGYDAGDYGFSRTLDSSCIICHSGLAQPASAGSGGYQNPPFLQLAVGCENCHGPGQLHVRQRLAAAPLSGNFDPAIVNPAQLPGWLSDNICMRCHDGGSVRVLQPGKTYFDYRPGAPLDNTLAIFSLPLERERSGQSPLLQHYSLMVLSKCYAGSGGKLHCITCHDPHQQPSGATAAAHYREKCLGCHEEADCTVKQSSRQSTSPADNCIECHMPKQSLASISHSALTNHRIVTRPGEAYPDVAFHQTTPELPDLVHVDAIPGPRAQVDPATLLQAYGQLMEAHPRFRARYDEMLDRLIHTEPTNPVVLGGLARRLAQKPSAQATNEAIRDLSQAIERRPGTSQDYELLATLLAQAGRVPEALAAVQRALGFDPYDRRLYDLEVEFYTATHRYSDAKKAMRAKLDLFPQDSSTRQLLKALDFAGP